MRTVAFVIGLLLAAPALAQTMAEKAGVNSALGVAPKTADFVKEATISDMFEIQTGQMASAKLNGPAKDFADQMIKDHTKTSDELAATAKAAHIALPPDLDAAHKRMINTLNSQDDTNFQKRYFDDQVSAHKDAVSLFQRYAKGGDNAKLKSWAATTLPTLQHHLEMAEQLDK